ncbi:MAG: DNA-processing protein DprA [Ignavibacteriaceae bacterium]
MTRLNFDQLTDLISLLSVDRIGPAKIRSLLAKFKTTDNILNASLNELLAVEGISNQLAKRLIQTGMNRSQIEQKVEKLLQRIEKINFQIVSIWDEEYPPLLKKIYDPPLLLYVSGKFNDMDKYSVAIVGTRTPTNYGRIQTEKIANDLSKQGITIVSGLARGIDSIAHKTALKSGGRTIAVTGSGPDVIYPPENKDLFKNISGTGVVITEYEPGTKPDVQNFPRRNRIISGLSLGTVVIETGEAGGAMQTAAFALDQNREVFAVPGNLGVKQSEGTNLLIQKGEAKLIRSAEDILEELELKLKPVLGKNIPKPDPELNVFEEKIISILNNEPLHIDKISALTNLASSDCLVHLLSLEFKGMIKQLPGKMFCLI